MYIKLLHTPKFEECRRVFSNSKFTFPPQIAKISLLMVSFVNIMNDQYKGIRY